MTPLDYMDAVEVEYVSITKNKLQFKTGGKMYFYEWDNEKKGWICE